ncbi:VOC family protein [Streptomyces sp. NPDC004647]|uniref:VOC family protein n=1 Tax=Streptomyces sp. NPDC004647 TaxID=3154671 RepID=UPI0033B47DDA
MPFPNPVRHITFDARDPYAQAQFWSALTGWLLEDSDPGDDAVLLESGQSGVPGLLFLRVPEDKTVKNRIHLDIQPPTDTRDAEVGRLAGLGAEVVADHRTDDGLGWVVMADPEGNEFCVERSAAERGLTA